MGSSLMTNPSHDKNLLAYFPKSIQMICVYPHIHPIIYEFFLAYQSPKTQVLQFCMDYLLSKSILFYHLYNTRMLFI